MLSSASFNGITGVILSFLPEEVLTLFGETPTGFSTLALQVSGALLLGFSMMNYTARKAVMGGIYNRPLQMGNTVYYFIASITLFKYMTGQSSMASPALWVVSLTYILLAVSFLKLLFSSPVKEADA